MNEIFPVLLELLVAGVTVSRDMQAKTRHRANRLLAQYISTPARLAGSAPLHIPLAFSRPFSNHRVSHLPNLCQ
jgi:hypothetical protein